MQNVIKKLDRMSVRALAERNFTEMQTIAAAGGNSYQKSLEHQDEISEFAHSMESDDAIAFLNMYTEELNACNQKIADDTNMILSKAEATNHMVEAVGGFIGLLVLLLVIFMVFK